MQKRAESTKIQNPFLSSMFDLYICPVFRVAVFCYPVGGQVLPPTQDQLWRGFTTKSWSLAENTRNCSSDLLEVRSLQNWCFSPAWGWWKTDAAEEKPRTCVCVCVCVCVCFCFCFVGCNCLLTVGSFLLTVELFYLQLTISAFFLQLKPFSLTALAFLLTVGAFLLAVGKCI